MRQWLPSFGLLFLVFLPILLDSFAISRMAAHLGLRRPWLAFLPVGSGYILGRLAEPEILRDTGRQRWLSVWVPFHQGASLLGYGLAHLFFWLENNTPFFLPMGLFGLMAAIAYLCGQVGYLISHTYALYYVYKGCQRERAFLYTLGSLLVFPLEGILLLLMMDLVPRSVTGKKQYLGGQPRFDKNHQWEPPPQKPGKPKGGKRPPSNPRPRRR